MLLVLRWLLFRLEFGAGLIKMRGDRCWKDLTCLYYHHETQPMPGPFSWYFHRLPKPLHKVEVLGNHFAQLVVPFGLFAPQPVAAVAATIMIVTQLWLVASGNFSWLNWTTIVLGLSVIPDDVYEKVLPFDVPPPRLGADALRRAGDRGDGTRRRVELLADSQHDLPRPAHECVVQQVALRQHVRRVRQHHPGALRGDRGGHVGRACQCALRVEGVRLQGKAG